MQARTSAAGKRVLLIAPRYFGYDLEIAAQLRSAGASVDMLADRPFNASVLKAMTRVQPQLIAPFADRHYARELERLGERSYDLVLVVQGEAISARTLQRIRAAYPRARLVFYTWDSLDNKRFARAKLGHYDQCFTFDPIDASAYGMHVRPLFFAEGFERTTPERFDHDISFVGTIHSDRYAVVHRVDEALPPHARRYWYLYMQAPWMFWARKLFTGTVSGARRAEFSFAPLSKDAVQKLFFRSRAVLDVEHPLQRGLTMRTIEAMGSGTKVITTNAAARDYDFYDPRNVCVIDRERPRIPGDFLVSPYQPPDEAIVRRYTLAHWLAEVSGWDIARRVHAAHEA